MTDPRLYDTETYVVLEPGQPEQFLSSDELLEKLQRILVGRAGNLPYDLQQLSSTQEQAQYLLENACELTLEPGQFLQWYAVRLEKE
jgi:hypothetical protein